MAIPSVTINKSSASHKVAIPSATLGKKHEPIQKTNYISILQKAMIGMNSEAQFQCNKLLKLDKIMLMYRINNAETLEKLINTVKELHYVCNHLDYSK